MTDDVMTIRAFNRTVIRRLGVLNEKYLGREHPLIESRLLFEIGADGVLVRDLRARLGLDSGFLSRTLRALEGKRLLNTIKHRVDGRTRFVKLTRQGAAELRRIDVLSNKLAESLVAPLAGKQTSRLISAMADVDRLLRASGVEIAQTLPGSSEARWCLEQYFDELASRFEGGFDRDAGMAYDVECFVPPDGTFLVAQLFGTSVGCGALRTLGGGVGEIKRMWLAPEMRGLGVGRRLLAALEHAACERKMRAIRLDTHESLTEAIQFYRLSGYREIARYNNNPYAHHWFDKTLTMRRRA